MYKITSSDGTSIAVDRLGAGPAVILISGGPVDRSSTAGLAERLAADFTVYNYDRRGRGDSGDASPYAVDREYEDIAALIGVAGGSAMVYGTSGGGIIGLEAAARGLAVTKLVVWEPPFVIPGTRPPVPADYQARLRDLLAQNRRGDMVELFLTEAAGIPGEFVAQLRQSPFWAGQEAVAPALVYDAMIVKDFAVPTERLATVTVPTVVLDGGTVDWLTRSADAVAAALPAATRRTLAGQPHNVDDAAVAPAIAAHFAE
ncbi:MAG: alpha/beta fold hydrolase [Natronosporangium sp.]